MNKLHKALEEYLEIRRGVGFKLREAAGLLRQFVALADKDGACFVSRKLALKWATQPPNALRSTWARRLGMVRGFAEFLSTLDPRTEIPPQNLLPYRYQRKPRISIRTKRFLR